MTVNDDRDPPRKRLTRAEAKARTRGLLLDAAAHTFAQKGYAGASVEQIAEAAGFSIGAIYSNFGGKDELFVELLSEHAAGRLDEAARILSGEGTETENPVEALGRMLASVADEESDLAPLQAEFWLYAVRNPGTMEILAGQSRNTRQALAQMITRRIDDVGMTMSAPVDTVATVILALFQGLVQQRRIDPDTVPDELFGQALRWMFAGLAADPAPASPSAARDHRTGPSRP